MSDNLIIQETYIDKTGNFIIGETEEYESFTDDIGKLFKVLQKEYGKCVSKVYIDDKKGNAKQRGWVFEKKEQYTDVEEYYINETWVTVCNHNFN